MPPKQLNWSMFAHRLPQPQTTVLFDRLSCTLPRIWQQMDHFKRYPLSNRGIAAFFSQEIAKQINNYRSQVVNDANLTHLYNHWEDVFTNLELSAEYLLPQNKDYICASFANALACINYYSKSQNIGIDATHISLIKMAEHFSLWGTGRCGEVTSLIYLLLANADVRPIEFVALKGCTSSQSEHSLILIGRDLATDLNAIYNSDVFVVDYWSGCIGEARTLFNFNGPLSAFKSRPVEKQAGLTSSDVIPKFIAPNEVDISGISSLIEKLYLKFIGSQRQKCQKQIQQLTNPNLFFLASKYKEVASGYDFHNEDSSYCTPDDPYDDQRAKNIAAFIPEPTEAPDLSLLNSL
jgi:hypothetical protein